MASVFYVGQTMLVTATSNKKPLQGTAIVVSKYIEKGKIYASVLGMDGVEYSNVSSDQLSYLNQKKKNHLSIYPGIICTFKMACGNLPKQTLKNDRKKLLDHLKEAWELLQKGTLVAEAFTAKEEVVEQQTVVE